MASTGTCNWIGASGAVYIYHIHALPIDPFNNNQDGNYIFTKLVNKKWSPIYIGEGDLGDRVSDNHHKAKCISQKGATHVHVHLNAIEAERLSEEQDLLAHYSQAYVPTGCNEKEGG